MAKHRKHSDAKIIQALGGTFAVARMFSIKPPSVSQWTVRGIPPARRMYLQLLRPDLFKRRRRAAP